VTSSTQKTRFSIITFLSVLVVLAVLAVAAALVFSPFRHLQLASAVDRVLSDVRYCQEMAIYADVPYGIAFEPARSRYTICRYEGGKRAGVRDPATKAFPWRIDFTAGVYKGFKIAFAEDGGGSELVFAAGAGVPCGAGGAPLKKRASVSVTSSAGTITVNVDPQTGYAWRS